MTETALEFQNVDILFTRETGEESSAHQAAGTRIARCGRHPSAYRRDIRRGGGRGGREP
jgi:hypothetical protein